MSTLQRKITPEEEEDFDIESYDFLRPGLKQIGNSVFEIKKYFVPGGGFHFVPSTFKSHFRGIRDQFLEVLEKTNYLCERELLTGKAIDSSVRQNFPRGFAFIFESFALAVSVDIDISPRPISAKSDVLIVLPYQPIIVITLVDGEPESKDAVRYNKSIASGLISALSRFLNECVNPVYGVLDTAALKCGLTFQSQLELFARKSSLFVTNESLSMNSEKYEKIVTAIWAGVAETKSILSDSGSVDAAYVRFLTKEQCIVLVENINNREVKVSCQPGCGATTLMLEVARRLSRLGDTLLVCESEEDRDRLRRVHATTELPADITSTDLFKYTNIVDDTGAIRDEKNARVWQFSKVFTTTDESEAFGIKRKADLDTDHSDEVKKTKASTEQNEKDLGEGHHLRNRLSCLEREKDYSEKLVFLLTLDERRTKAEYLAREVDTLKLYDMKRHAYNHQMCEDQLGKQNFENAEAWEQKLETMLRNLREGLQQRTDLFHVLRTNLTKDKRRLAYLQAKAAYMEKEVALSTNSDVLEKDYSEKLVFLLTLDERRTKAEYLAREVDTLKLYDMKRHAYNHMCEDQLGKQNFENAEAWEQKLETMLRNLREGLQQRTDLFHVLRTNLTKDKRRLAYLQAKAAYMEKEVALSTNSDVLEAHKGFADKSKAEKPDLSIDMDDMQELEDRLKTLERERDTNYQEMNKQFEGQSIIEGQCILDFLSVTIMPMAIHRTVMDAVGDIIPMTLDHSENEVCWKDPIISDQRHEPGRQMFLLRKFQLGKLGQRRLFGLLEAVITRDHDSLVRIEDKCITLEQDYGCPVHIVGEFDSVRCRPVSCYPMAFEKAHRYCHISPNGNLLNIRNNNPEDSEIRFTKYYGTCSTSQITLPTFLDTFTLIHPCAKYWETNTHLEVKKRVTINTLLEMGLSEESVLDTDAWISNQKRSWAINVTICTDHDRGICTRVIGEAKQVGKCWTHTMPHTEGKSAVLNYGIVLDIGLGKIGFIDLNREMVLHTLNVTFKESVFPMFGVYPSPDYYTLNMTLVSGKDIAMTERKQALIWQALSRQDLVKEIITKDQDSQVRIDGKPISLEQVYDCPVGVVGEHDSVCGKQVSYSAMAFEKARLHKYCHISPNGNLLNTRNKNPEESETRFTKYYGTCSTSEIDTCIEYWETNTHLEVKKRVTADILLEMGLSEKSVVDSDIWISNQRRSWAINVTICTDHDRGICTRVIGEAKQVGKCWTHTMPHTEGESAVLSYGIVLDFGRGKIGFIDLNREMVLHTFSVAFKESVFPMFGVYPSPDFYSVDMTLVSGNDIAMTERKQALIWQALSRQDLV